MFDYDLRAFESKSLYFYGPCGGYKKIQAELHSTIIFYKYNTTIDPERESY